MLEFLKELPVSVVIAFIWTILTMLGYLINPILGMGIGIAACALVFARFCYEVDG